MGKCAGFILGLAVGVAADAPAAVLKVGPGGTYPTVQSALDAAATLAGLNEVRIRMGVYTENVSRPSCCAGTLRVSGGWDGTFSVQNADPRTTVLDGRGIARTLELATIDSGSLLLENLTLRNGRLNLSGVTGWGAGLRSSVQGSGGLTVRNIHVRDNVIRPIVEGPTEGHGAGAFLLVGSPRVVVEGCLFEANRLEGPPGTALRSHGGGMEVQVFEGGRAVIRSTQFRHNRSAGSETALGGGLKAMVQYNPGLSPLTLEGLRFEQNATTAEGSASAADLWAGDGAGFPSIVMSRCRILKNGLGSQQLRVHAEDWARVDVSDTEVWGGDESAISASSHDGGYVNLTNLTVADNALRGIKATSSGANLSIVNVISHGNGWAGLETAGPIFMGFNLVDVDPLFRDRVAGDYRLRPESPARDTGSNGPVAGLGPRDLSGGPRIVGSRVDVGADEIDP